MPEFAAIEIETLLLRWGESSTAGRTVTLELFPEPGEHPMKGFQAGKNGQRFMMRLVPILDDETLAESEPSRETRVEHIGAAAAVDTPNRSEIGRQVYAAKTPGEKLVSDAGRLCKDKTFRDWIGMGMTEEMAAQWMRERLQVKSRGDLATDAAAQERFLDIKWQYEHRDDPNV